MALLLEVLSSFRQPPPSSLFCRVLATISDSLPFHEFSVTFSNVERLSFFNFIVDQNALSPPPIIYLIPAAKAKAEAKAPAAQTRGLILTRDRL